MTARRRRQCQIRNSVDRSPGPQARLKDQKVDVRQYPGEEIPAGTICPARHSHQIQRDPLATPQLCWRRAGAIAFEGSLHKGSRLLAEGQRVRAAAIKTSAYCSLL